MSDTTYVTNVSCVASYTTTLEKINKLYIHLAMI